MTTVEPITADALAGLKTNTAQEVACRILDVVVATLALIVAVPLMLAIAVAIRIDSRGPALFRQQRLGRALEPFTVHKFRTMRDGVGHEVHRTYVVGLISGESTAQDRDIRGTSSRTTRGSPGSVACFVVPALTNFRSCGTYFAVACRSSGRVPRSLEVEHHPEAWFERFAVKPGITGLWQVSGRSELTVADMVSLDIEYVHRRSLRYNAWLLLRTVPAVLSLRGAA